MTYKRYTKYKDSEISWIGKIPNQWECLDFRRLVNLQQGLQIAQEERFYEGGINRFEYITIKYLSSKNKKIDREYIENPNKKVICNHDDVLLARTGATGKVVTGVIGVYHNNFFKINYDRKRVLKGFLVYYLMQENIQEHFKLIAGTTTIPDLNHGEFLSTKIILPNLFEQERIIKFLDKKTLEIDSLIEEKEKLIKLLKEKREAIITEAITKGIDKNVKMKDSGVEWIGVIPESWNISKIKYSTYVKGRIGWQGLKSEEFIDEGPYLVTGTDFENGRIDWNKCYHISEERYNEAIPIQLRENDLLITKDGTIGKIAIVTNKPNKAILNSGIFVTRCLNSEYYTEFMYFVLNSKVFSNYIKYMETGSTIKHLYQETFENFKYMLPNKSDQMKIVDYIKNKVENLDEIIKKITLEINLLNEYKKSLISEVVTGKIDIRNEL